MNQYIKLLRQIPLKDIIKGVSIKCQERLKMHWQYKKDKNNSTYLEKTPFDPTLNSFFSPFDKNLILSFSEQILDTSQLFLNHCFDLLGSGWTHVRHGTPCRGIKGLPINCRKPVDADNRGKWLENLIPKNNLPHSQMIWELIYRNPFQEETGPVEDYVPIDWQLDFKSGYRWQENIWYRKIKCGPQLGADLKVPLELSRMQHLPQLAWAHCLTANFDSKNSYFLSDHDHNSWKPPARYALEFRSQILDFIATNPPRFGVNWYYSMDIAIRAANWLTTYDFFTVQGVIFDKEFVKTFVKSIFEHGYHIINNLEWRPDFSTNHYLANIVGLIFISAYLPSHPVTDKWLKFAGNELIRQTVIHFNPEGTDTEASTSYHCLTTEMLLYGTVIILSLPDAKKGCLFKSGTQSNLFSSFFNAKHFDILKKAGTFIKHCTKPDHHIVQIGDNDSGRFFKFQPIFDKLTVKEAHQKYLNLDKNYTLKDCKIYWDENILDKRPIVAAIAELFLSSKSSAQDSAQWIEQAVVKQLFKNYPIPHSYKKKSDRLNKTILLKKSDAHLINDSTHSETINSICTINLKNNIDIESIHLHSYPQFGLFIYKSDNFFMSIRCGVIGQNGNGGHAHNDQLSICLFADGKNLISDPGSYVYTALPEKRNAFRSYAVHFVPVFVTEEPEHIDKDLFSLSNRTKSRCLSLSRTQFTGLLQWNETIYLRRIQLSHDKILVTDMDLSPDKVFSSPENYTFKRDIHRLFSNGYGKILRNY